MATHLKNLSEYEYPAKINVEEKVLAVVVSEYNSQVTEALYRGAMETLVKEGVKKENIYTIKVPGAFELCYAAQKMVQRPVVDAVICLGCIIQGETKHFDFIGNAVANGLMEVSLKYDKPVIFGVLTPNTLQQALERAGGIYGNKGVEAAITAIKMLGI